MKFWTKRTAALMGLLWLLLAYNTWSAGGGVTVFVGAAGITGAIAWLIKWLYVTARTPPAGEESEPEVEAAD